MFVAGGEGGEVIHAGGADMAAEVARSGHFSPSVPGVAQELQVFAGRPRFAAEGGSNREAHFHTADRRVLHRDVHDDTGGIAAQGESGSGGRHAGSRAQDNGRGDGWLRVGNENYHAGRRAVGTAYRDDSAPAVDAAVHPVGRVGGYPSAVQLSVNAPHGTVNVRSVPAQGIGGNADSVGIAVAGVNCVAEFDNAALGAGVGGLPLPTADGQRQLRAARNRYRLAEVRLQLQRLAQAVSVANQGRRRDMDAGNAGRNVEPAVHLVAAIVSQGVAA